MKIGDLIEIREEFDGMYHGTLVFLGDAVLVIEDSRDGEKMTFNWDSITNVEVVDE